MKSPPSQAEKKKEINSIDDLSLGNLTSLRVAHQTLLDRAIQEREKIDERITQLKLLLRLFDAAIDKKPKV